MTKKLLIMTIVALVAAPIAAAPRRITFEPATSDLTFTLDTTLHVVHGTMGLTGGEIAFDLESGEADGQIVVNAADAETGNRKRDSKMHHKVLETALFPSFVFHAERVSGQLDEAGEGRVELIGTLEIHGDSHPFTLPARVKITRDRVEAHSEFVIPYVEWGMKDPSLFVIRAAKTVDVVVNARGRFERQVASVSAP